MTQQAWAAQAERESKRTADRLGTTLEDGRRMRPLHFESKPLSVASDRSPTTDAPEVWTRVTGPDLAAANKALLADLAGGVRGLILAAEGVHALPLFKPNDLVRLLDGVLMDAIAVGCEPSAASKSVADLVAGYITSKATARVHFGFDAIGTVATFGGSRDTLDALYDDAAWAIGTLAPDFVRSRVLTVSAVPYHEAGASPDFELACLLGNLVATLRALEQRGVSLQAAAAQLSLVVPVDADFMLGLVKLRAARALVARVLEACAVPKEFRSPPLLAVSSRRMLTRFEPFANALRGTAGSFAALAGGADFVEVAPYDERSPSRSDAGGRLARNTTHVLLEESQVARVLDPAAGAFFFEAETRALAESAWQTFQSVEAEGGLADLLFRGRVALAAGANYFEQEHRISTRARALTGITEFADLAPVEISQTPAPPEPPAPALSRVHLARPFERLRAASERYRAQTGHLPEVQLLTLGPSAEHDARTGWVTNLLAAGGLVATSGARPVVIVSGSDLRYEAEAAPMAQKLKASGAVSHVSLAGKPKHETAFRLAGYDAFIFRGEDVTSFLAELHLALEVGS